MGYGVKAAVCAVVGLTLVPAVVNAQSRSQYREGAPGDYHTYKPPRFDPSSQPTTPRQATPQKPAQREPYITNRNAARPGR